MISIEPSWPLSGRAGNPDVDRVADLRPQRGLAGRVVERGRYRAAPIDSKGLPAVGRGAQPRSAVAAAWLLAGLRSLRASVHPGARRAGSQGHSRRFERKRRKSDGYHCCGCVETSSISRSSCDSHGLSAAKAQFRSGSRRLPLEARVDRRQATRVPGCVCRQARSQRERAAGDPCVWPCSCPRMRTYLPAVP